MRIVYAAGDIDKELPVNGITEFMNHAIGLFQNFEITESEKQRLEELRKLSDSLEQYKQDPLKRLRWAEDVLTIRALL